MTDTSATLNRPPSPPASALDTPQAHRLGLVLLVAVAMAAIGQRIFLIATTDFPLNDGGLFYVFIKAISASFPALPDTVSYNGLDIPFAYPPLAFWIAAAFERIGIDPLSTLRVAPILLNMAYVLLFVVVLYRAGRSLLFIGIALLFTSTMLRTFEWLVMGGGLSRGLGSLFLMLTLVAIRTPEGERRVLPMSNLIAAGACVGGAILSHLEWGIDAAACVVLSRLLGSADFKDLIRSVLIPGVVALLLIGPWVLNILVVHGLGPFVAAGGSSAWGAENFLWQIQNLASQTLDNPLIAIGAGILIWRRKFFWPAFLLVCIFLTPRHGPTPSTVAFGAFCAEAALGLAQWLRSRVQDPGLSTVAVAIVVLVFTLPRINSEFIGQGTNLHPLARENRDAMAWIAKNHAGSSFIVLNRAHWYYDSSAEWFPVLARARSTNTLQGREWIPGAYEIFYERDRLLKKSRTCAQILARLGVYERPQFVWAEIRHECFTAPGYRPIYSNGRVAIFEVAPATPPVTAPHSR